MEGGVISVCILVILAFCNCGAYTRYPYYGAPRYSPRATYSNYYRSSSYSPKTTECTKPLCSRGSTVLNVLVVEQEGGAVVDKAKVHYVDSEKVDIVTTDSNGCVDIIVIGCSVRLIVYRPQGQAVSKKVDLNSCDKNQKVVVALNDACNFYIFFDNKGLSRVLDFIGLPSEPVLPPPADDMANDFDDVPVLPLYFSDRVTYIYKSGKSTGHGELVGNQLSSPLCIHVDLEDHDNLEMTIISQSGNLFNRLSITNLLNLEFPFAYITIPLANPYDSENFDLYIFFNLVGYNIGFGPILTFINNVKLSDVLIYDDQTDSTEPTYSWESLCIRVDDGEMTTGIAYLIAVKFNIGADVYFKGNAALIDATGCSETTEITEDFYPGSTPDMYWVVGCMCDGADINQYKPINMFMVKTAFDTFAEVQALCNCP